MLVIVGFLPPFRTVLVAGRLADIEVIQNKFVISSCIGIRFLFHYSFHDSSLLCDLLLTHGSSFILAAMVTLDFFLAKMPSLGTRQLRNFFSMRTGKSLIMDTNIAFTWKILVIRRIINILVTSSHACCYMYYITNI